MRAPTCQGRFTKPGCGKAGNACTFSNAEFRTNITMAKRSADSATECGDRAVEFLEKHDGAKPFFMYLAPPVPHDPRLAPAELRDDLAGRSRRAGCTCCAQQPVERAEIRWWQRLAGGGRTCCG